MIDRSTLTATSGTEGAVTDSSTSTGAYRPGPLRDDQLIEKLARQDQEPLPERIVYADGWGAHGTFTVTNDITCYSCAGIFAEVGKTTPVVTRFSTIAGGQGATAAERDVLGFAVKFYTDEGNWDLVGNNTPVFFFRDPQKFPGFIHTQKRDPATGSRSATAIWDFWSRSPEAVHQITMLMSDRGRPPTVRHMNGYGSHTFSLLNADNERFWVKFHFKTLQGHAHRTEEEAGQRIGGTRVSPRRDLCRSIEQGDFPKWRLCIQVMPEADAEKPPYNPFDVTKVWPTADYPLIDVGVLELNRNPENEVAEIEQAAFSPSNIVPGIGFSPDRMLQARIFSYAAAHRYRLGDRYAELPVNAPKAAVEDGTEGAPTGNAVESPEPDAQGAPEGPVHAGGYRPQPLRISGGADCFGYRSSDRDIDGDYNQAGTLFRLMDADARERLMDTIAEAMRDVPADIVQRQVAHFHAADPDYGSGVATRLGLMADDPPKPQAAA